MEHVTLTAPDISCEHCRTTIEREVAALGGIESCSVDVPTRQIALTYDPALVTRDRIEEVLEEEGYPVSA